MALLSRISDLLSKNRRNIRHAMLQGLRIASGLVVMRLSALVISIVVAKTAGAATLGEYTLFLTLFVLTAEILYAFDMAFIREAGATKDAAQQHQYLRWTVISKTLCVFALTFFVLGISEVVSGFFGKQGAGNVMTWAIVAGALNALFMSMTARFQQQQRFDVVSMLQPLPNVAILIGVALVAWLGELSSIGEIIYIYVGVGFLLGLAGTGHALLRERARSDEDRLSNAGLKAYMLTIGALLLSKALALVSIRLDIFFIGNALSYEEMGLYGVALRLSALVALITVVTNTHILPRAAEAMADAGRFKRYLGLAGLYIGLQTGIALLVLAFVGPIITLTFGAEYESATFITGVLMVQALFTAYAGPFQSLMQCGMPPSLTVMIAGFRMAISLPLLWFAVPRFGLDGAAIAVAVVAFVIFCVQFVLVWRNRPRLAV